jgi:hypothetical protein
MSKRNDSFIQRCLRGEAMFDEIDDYVEGWHSSAEDVDIHTFLGMTSKEYALWIRDPYTLPYIIASRHENIPLRQIVNDNYEQARLAARSADGLKVRRLKSWLQQQGKLD